MKQKSSMDPSNTSQDALYDLVAEELQRQDYKPGLLARATAESGGDERQTRAAYIRLRVEQLARAEEPTGAKACGDEQNRRKVEAVPRPRIASQKSKILPVAIVILVAVAGFVLVAFLALIPFINIPATKSTQVEPAKGDYEGPEAEFVVRHLIRNLPSIEPQVSKPYVLVKGPALESCSGEFAIRLDDLQVTFVNADTLVLQGSEKHIAVTRAGIVPITIQVAEVRSDGSGSYDVTVGWAWKALWERYHYRVTSEAGHLAIRERTRIQGNYSP